MSHPERIAGDLPRANTAEEYQPERDPHLKRARKWCPRCRREYVGYTWSDRAPIPTMRQALDAEGRVIGICADCSRELEQRGPAGRRPQPDDVLHLQPPRRAFSEREDD